MSEMDLGKQVGPLPLGAWLAVVGGGLALGFYVNKRNSKNQNDAEQLTESGVGAGGTGGFASVSPPTDTAPGEDDTNQKWQQRATNWLVANGYDPITSDNAIRKYLTGQGLNLQERAIVSQALAHFGIPPESVSGPAPSGPNAVTGLIATLVTSNSVTLAWAPVPGATKYRIVASSQYGAWEAVETTVPSWTSASVAPLGANLEHTFYVTALNDYAASEPRSVTVTTRPGATAPAPTLGPTPAPPAAPPQQPQGRRYTIQGGDTLSGISLRMHGTPGRWREIYNDNVGAIEGEARRRGKANSSGPGGQVGWWIFPGMVLNIR